MLAPPLVAERRREIAWCGDYLADLEADFRAWYRETDILALPGPQFFRLAMRTVAYQGVMAARVEALQQADAAGAPREDPGTYREAGRSQSGVREVEATREGIASSPVLAGLIDWEG